MCVTLISVHTRALNQYDIAMDSETIGRMAAIGLLLVVSFPLHEAAHATVAWKLGDGVARAMGRVSLNPRRHLDPLGAALLLLSAIFGGWLIGWAKPTPVLAQNLRGGRFGLAAVALAGPLSNLLVAVVCALLYRCAPTSASWDLLNWLLAYFCYFNLLLLFLNLLPIPPFDGRAVLSALLGLLSPRLAEMLERAAASRFAFPVVIAVIFFTPIGSFLGDLSLGLANALLGPA
jgi:hypothetical protein